jgi:hypothetical protein
MLQQVIQLLLNQSDSLLNDVSMCEYIKRYIEWYIVILYWFIYSHPRSSWVRVVFDFNASASDSAPFESIWFPVDDNGRVCLCRQKSYKLNKFCFQNAWIRTTKPFHENERKSTDSLKSHVFQRKNNIIREVSKKQCLLKLNEKFFPTEQIESFERVAVQCTTSNQLLKKFIETE